MAKVKNKRQNHNTKRVQYYAERGRELPGKEGGREGRRDHEAKASRESRTSRDNSASRDNRASRDNHAGRYESEGKAGRSAARFGADRSPDRNPARYETHNEADSNIIIGRNPVMEALKNDRQVDKLMVSSREGSMIKILALAKEKSVPVIMVEKAALDRIAAGRPHQGVAAYISPYEYAEMEDIFALAKSRGEDPFLIILDNLEDPHNLGAIMRTAECAGAHGIIIPRRHACGLTEVVAKASAGAIEYMPCVKVTNIAQTIDELKAQGIWVAACDMGGKPYYQADLKGKLAVVIGSEGAGISKLVREKCDYVVSMPMVGKITSLNASNAAAVIIYEVRKQRDGNA